MKSHLGLLPLLLLGGVTSAIAATPVVVQDFEKPSSLPKIWVVNIPDSNASVKLAADRFFDGKQSLQLHYHFTAAGQYLGVPIPVTIKAPIHKLHFRLYGDNSGVGYGLYLQDASGETHKFRDPGTMKVDFAGWRDITVNLDAGHESWDGDKNGKLDYPITQITFEVSNGSNRPVESNLFFDAITVDSERSEAETLNCQISMISPAYCSDIKGNTPITLAAPGFKSVLVKAWKPGSSFGLDQTVATVNLDAKGKGSFVFPADSYPHGPITLTVTGVAGETTDNCYLQFYNKGGVSWHEGMPKDPPPAAKGLDLVFADDFTGPLSISSTDPKATYYDHKPPNGSQDFSSIPFTSHDKPNTPFAQVDTYLRIRASEKNRSAGLISSLRNDGSGIKVGVPCYFECRFIGPNAIGTWPAFWLLTDYINTSDAQGVDEIDIIEAYGGEGPKHPNAFDRYMITPHAWNQGDAGKEMGDRLFKGLKNPCRMSAYGIPTTWYDGFHTYGCKITETDTIYYCDDIEVGRHETMPISKQRPFFFLINLATGGGWPVDLSRYDGTTDMYVDYVRVYGKK